MTGPEQFRNAVGLPAEQQPAKQDPTSQLFALLEKRKDSIRSLLPPTVDINVFMGVVKTAVLNNPDLATADQRTFFTACLQAAQRGVLPDGKECVLNVYNTNVAKKNEEPKWVRQVQFQPMWQGLVKKMYESGEITYVDGAAVYERDIFKFQRGDEAKLQHEPTGADDPGPIVAAYVVVKLKSGEIKREVLWRRDIEKIRSMSKASTGPGWTTWYDQYAIKAAGKRMAKQLPMTPSLAQLRELVDDDNKVMAEPLFDAPASTTAAITHDPGQPATFVGSPQPKAEVVDAPKRKHRRKEPAATIQQAAMTAAQASSGEPTLNELRFMDFKVAIEEAPSAERIDQLVAAAIKLQDAAGAKMFSEAQMTGLAEIAEARRSKVR